MRLPIQKEPVQRTIASQPWANRGNGTAIDANGVTGGQGVVPSEYGVQPSGWQDWVKTIGGGILSML